MYITVFVKPSSSRERVVRLAGGEFMIDVKEEASGNKANKRAIFILAKHFNASPTRIRLVSGHHSRKKVFSITST
jgi:uncharacterized protein YggU (UPF0235/DUF167 family)